MLIYKSEIKLLYFYDAMLVNGKSSFYKAKRLLQRKFLWRSGAKELLNMAPAFNKRANKYWALVS